PVLFRLSHNYVGDLAETTALIWPTPRDLPPPSAGEGGPRVSEGRERALSRPFVVTDPYLAGSGRVEALLERLASAGTRATVFADTVPDPTVASV
ncbi:hypothetical protein MKK69_22210, partial [Methylobacterium sp. J-026]|nr:hypothetical protein [Methylobacterium sp. J-026]